MVSRTRDSLPNLGDFSFVVIGALFVGGALGAVVAVVTFGAATPLIIILPAAGAAIGGGVSSRETLKNSHVFKAVQEFLKGRRVRIYEQGNFTDGNGTTSKGLSLICNNTESAKKTITKKEHVPAIIEIVKDIISLWRDFAEENEGTAWGEARGWYLSTIKEKMIKNYGELLDDDEYKTAIKEHIEALKWEKK